jgi:hypothetical protein
MTTWIRKSHLATRYVDGEAFVIAENAIENLTPLAAAIWRLLALGRTEAAIGTILERRYPGVEPSRIAGDVALLVSQLARKGLIEPVSAPVARKAGRPRSTAR